MYVPPHFRETDLATLHGFIERHSFATLISQDAAEPVASHLPLLLDRERGPNGWLEGHMAQANAHWQSAAGRRVLAIFHGPHAYVSPTWYESENVVPTWNYVAVHAYGTLRLIEVRERLVHLVRRTVERYEAPMSSPWSIDSQDPGFLSRMLDGIVGYAIEVDRLEGKWKLNQNHSVERRRRVIERLRESDAPDAREIARLMEDL